MRLLLIVLMISASGAVSAQQLLRVVQPVWAGLTLPERDAIQQRYLIEVVRPETFGLILDNQGVDESTAGSNAGSNLGIALGSATYIDKAFRDGNYSAKGQLGAMLLGGLVGAALDRPPESRFHYRYSVRTGDGNIQYIDSVGSDPFRHPIGVCVNLPIIALAPDQHLCTQTLASFRSSYLGASVDPLNSIVSTAPTNTLTPASLVSRTVEASQSDMVDCKPNSLAPIRTTAEKCKLINGTIVQ